MVTLYPRRNRASQDPSGSGTLVFLSEGEIGPFLAELKPWGREAARLFLQRGLRLDEADFLEWTDVDPPLYAKASLLNKRTVKEPNKLIFVIPLIVLSSF